MAVKYQDLELAYDFVNSGPYDDHSALLNRSTGQIYWSSESGDLDEISEEMWESDDAVEIPHKEDLDLGNRLVFRFVDSCAPDHYGRVRDMFGSRGAYARYKELKGFSRSGMRMRQTRKRERFVIGRGKTE